MALNLEYLRIFHTVARHKSISRAAEELHLSQPTVTKELRRLEEQLGFYLFLRHSRGVRLTHEGEYLLRQLEPGMKALLKTESEAERLRNLDGGIIRVNYNTHSTQSVLSDYLKDFLDAYPGFVIDSCIAQRSMICTLLDQGVVDISLGHRPASFAVDHRLDDAPISQWKPETLAGYSLGVFEDVLLVGPPLAHLTESAHNLNELASYPLIFQRKLDIVGQNMYSSRIGQTEEARARNFCTEDLLALFRLIQHEPYIAVISSLGERQYKKVPDLYPLQITEPLLKSEYLLHFSRQSPPCLAAAALIDYLLASSSFDCKKLEHGHIPKITEKKTREE